ALELFLAEEVKPNDWWCLMKPAKRVKPADSVQLLDSFGNRTSYSGRVIGKDESGRVNVRFEFDEDVKEVAERLGEVPLPPYIDRRSGEQPADRERYQTVYARDKGSVAAPTAGLHFTPELLN